MNLKDSIVIAISKGRILEEGMGLLKKMGIETLDNMSDSRKLIYQTNNNLLKLVIVRASDVPTYVGNGAADMGIVGKDTLVECNLNNIYTVPNSNIILATKYNIPETSYLKVYKKPLLFWNGSDLPNNEDVGKNTKDNEKVSLGQKPCFNSLEVILGKEVFSHLSDLFRYANFQDMICDNVYQPLPFLCEH